MGFIEQFMCKITGRERREIKKYSGGICFLTLQFNAN